MRCKTTYPNSKPSGVGEGKGKGTGHRLRGLQGAGAGSRNLGTAQCPSRNVEKQRRQYACRGLLVEPMDWDSGKGMEVGRGKVDYQGRGLASQPETMGDPEVSSNWW